MAPAKSAPSTISTAASSSDRSRASSPSRAFFVPDTNRRDTAERDVERARDRARSPIGSAARSTLRVATPASIRSIATRASRSPWAKTPWGRQRHLTGPFAVLDGVHAGPPDRQELPTHHHRGRCRAAPLMASFGVPGVPGAAQRVGFFVHDRQRRGQTGLDGDGHQAVPARLGDPAELHRQRVRQHLGQRLMKRARDSRMRTGPRE